jgi:hypothetical protein
MALSCFRRLGSKQYLAEALLEEGRWLLAEGAREAARLSLRETVALAEEIGDEDLLARGREGLTAVALAR